MPGGQFSNLKQQAKAVGLGDRWNEIKKMYHDVNLMFGDIVKVTPSSKVVGDMTLFMVQNDLTEKDIYERGDSLDYPQSVVDFFEGRLGVPYEDSRKSCRRSSSKAGSPLISVLVPSLTPLILKPSGQSSKMLNTTTPMKM